MKEHFKELYLSSKEAVENFNDLSFDRDVVWAFERIEELETALDTAMRWFEDEVPPNIIEELRKVRGEQ